MEDRKMTEAERAERAKELEKTPYGTQHPLMAEAWLKGRAARLVGEARESNPIRNYPGKQFQRAWFEGWDSVPVVKPIAAERPVRTSEPPITHISPPITTKDEAARYATPPVAPGGVFAPKDGFKAAERYVRPHVVPCPECRCLRLPTASGAGIAVVVRTIVSDLAYLWCRNCDHKFKLPATTMEVASLPGRDVSRLGIGPPYEEGEEPNPLFSDPK